MTTNVDITATYSPEDNKLRLYASQRLDAETYQRVREAGFKWAPKQELFVAPKWTCAREDLALELAGEIEPEQTTLAERAAMKAERLDSIGERRAQEASAYARAADRLSECFYMGQPILVGHHSERKARKTQERMHSAMDKATAAHRSVGYWQYRAAGVEHHANRKNSPTVRRNRIKTLLADFRSYQRAINDAHKQLALWEKITTPALITIALNSLPDIPFGLWSKVDNGEVTLEHARELCIANAEKIVTSETRARWILHTLHRLSYEREMLGAVSRYSGEIKATTLQIFLREQGADKPKATATGIGFKVSCDAPLPLHVGEGCEMELTESGWRDLMLDCGHVPAQKAPAKNPILNFVAPSGRVAVKNPYRHELEELPQVSLTKAEYAKIPTDSRGTRPSACGTFRVRIAPYPKHDGPRYSAGWAAIHISDQKNHPLPESMTMEAAE
ncbi:DUF3560 domain-containing protein [Palleronia caenipelagi]|uniref:DUF3560 domain-containing protein n=1 Tax=Palleronia caenipelagi TaxID=2489174 RepID=A0A547PLC9_9RHOB|nr:DUF3560 domain-containing protein [Palleronia caenipelagi]TRD14913.1 DUF3560 domain-containing protein [Palleronia caenipelagi]